MRCISYLRVSSESQSNSKNIDAILEFAKTKNFYPVEFIQETVSGTVHWKKRKIATIIDELKSGDVLIVSELSRLGRSLLEIMEILSIATHKEIKVYSVKGAWELDNTIQSKLIALCFSLAAEIERSLISQRTSEALRVLRDTKGIKLGRPIGSGKSKIDKYKPEIIALIKNGSTKKFIANRYNISESAFNSWCKKNINELVNRVNSSH